jgi:hypothetical protein
MKQNTWLQAIWHRRWLSGLLLRQTKASLNLGPIIHQAKSGYETRASTSNVILYGVPARALLLHTLVHGSDARTSTDFSRPNRSPSSMWPSQNSPPHAASLNTDESSPASPPASREGPVRALVGHGHVAVQEGPWHLSVLALQMCGPGLSPSWILITKSHCLIDPSATLLGFAILISPRVLRKAKGKQNLSLLSLSPNTRVYLERTRLNSQRISTPSF